MAAGTWRHKVSGGVAGGEAAGANTVCSRSLTGLRLKTVLPAADARVRHRQSPASLEGFVAPLPALLWCVWGGGGGIGSNWRHMCGKLR